MCKNVSKKSSVRQPNGHTKWKMKDVGCVKYDFEKHDKPFPRRVKTRRLSGDKKSGGRDVSHRMLWCTGTVCVRLPTGSLQTRFSAIDDFAVHV